MGKKITQFRKPECEATRDALDAALKGAGDALGVTFKSGNASYNDYSMTFKVEVSIIGGPSKTAEEFIRYCELGIIPFKPEDLNAVMELNGRSVSIEGYDRKRRKFPILVTELDSGKKRCTTVEAARLCLDRARGGVK